MVRMKYTSGPDFTRAAAHMKGEPSAHWYSAPVAPLGRDARIDASVHSPSATEAVPEAVADPDAALGVAPWFGNAVPPPEGVDEQPARAAGRAITAARASALAIRPRVISVALRMCGGLQMLRLKWRGVALFATGWASSTGPPRRWHLRSGGRLFHGIVLTGPEAADHTPAQPMAFFAVTWNTYEVPGVRPATVTEVPAGFPVAYV